MHSGALLPPGNLWLLDKDDKLTGEKSSVVSVMFYSFFDKVDSTKIARNRLTEKQVPAIQSMQLKKCLTDLRN